MARKESTRQKKRDGNREFAKSAARALGGAIIFSLPIFMTMEMWSTGLSIEPLRVAAALFVSYPVLVGMSHFLGFEPTFELIDDAVDGFVALAIGLITSFLMLVLLAVLDARTQASDLLAQTSLQAVPASFGALLAQSQLGSGSEKEEEEERIGVAGYAGELFFMFIGAVFLAFNIAPTEEVVLIAARATAWHMVALIIVSLLLLHAFAYAMQFAGTVQRAPGVSSTSALLHYGMPGYIIALLACGLLLWVFGRFDGSGLDHSLRMVVVLGMPASLGAAAARLVL